MGLCFKFRQQSYVEAGRNVLGPHRAKRDRLPLYVRAEELVRFGHQPLKSFYGFCLCVHRGQMMPYGCP
jgi:hypothetical protein